jgi:O-antigen/teichoic acid export membrane protein
LAALGTTALVIGGLLADGGVGVGLLRRPEAPSTDELSALLGFQLFVAVVLSAAAAAVGLVTGSAGLVAAAMLGALPVYSLRAPTTILCERNLDYAPIAAAEIAEAVAYAVVAVGLAAYGLGVWSIVIASVARAVVGTVVLLARGKHPLPRPSRRMAHVRPLLAFGFQFQSAGLVSVIRDEGLNLVVAIIGGVSQLGVWSLGRRFAQISFVLFESLWRVSYPVFSRLIDAGVDLRREIDRGLRFSAAGTGLALTGIAASAPALVPAMVGPGWGSVPGVIAVAAAGLAISGPVSVTLSGYLYAVGEAGLMLRALVVSALVWLVLASVLLPLVGVVGVAAAWTVSSWCEVVLLRRYARRSVHDLSLAGLRPALLAAAVVGPAFWFVARVNDGLVAGLLVAAAATTTFLLLLMVLDRSLLPTIRRYRRASLLTS